MAKTIFSRAEISEKANAAYQKVKKEGEVISCIILGVDYFKIGGELRRVLTITATGEQFVMNDKTKRYTRRETGNE